METYKLIPIVLFFLIAGIVFFSFYNPAPKLEFSEKSASTEGSANNSCTIYLNFTLSNFGTTANNVTVVAKIYGLGNKTITNEYLDIGKLKSDDIKKFKQEFTVFSDCNLIKGVDLDISSYEKSNLVQAIFKG